MLLRADVCYFKFLTGSAGHSRLLTMSRASGTPTVTWRCGLDELKSSGAVVDNYRYQHSFARRKGSNYELHNIMAIPVGTLQDFSFDQVNTERVYQVVTKSRTLQGKVFMVEVGKDVVWPAMPHREMILPQGGNLQSVAGAISGTSDPAVMKRTPHYR